MGGHLRRVALAAATAVVVAGVVVGPAAVGAPGGTACATAGEIRVRIVVDVGGASSTVSDVCVPVADRATGAELLVARARQLGTPPPRFEGGFLCAIDGFPETGCGEQTGDGYRYWSYWHGDAGSWTYANVGPAGWKLRDGDVEGWRFLDGGPESKAAPPRSAPTACPAPAPASAPPPAPARTTTTAAPTSATPPPAPAATTPGTASGTAPTTVPTTTSTAPPSTLDVAARPAAGSTGEGDERGDDDGPPVALLAVTAAIAALAVAAGLRFRAGRGP